MNETIPLVLDVGELAGLLLAIEHGLGVGDYTAQSGQGMVLGSLQRKLQSGEKPFLITSTELLAAVVAVQQLHKNMGSRGMVAVLERVTASLQAAWNSRMETWLQTGQS